MSIKVTDLNYLYSPGTAYEIQAVHNINLTINDGEFIGIIGHTGSGKSTLMQHLNGLIKATSGAIYYNGKNIYDEDFSMKELRNRVGLVFQYPEYQLFETDVFADVCFGPKNLGISDDEVKKRAEEALKAVGIDKQFFGNSPFELSGGQKRRVAIAGVLAMKPEVLILDEPTAGLDPQGRNEILGLISKLHAEQRLTVMVVSHSMEDMALYAERLIVMNHGSVQYDGTPKEVFRHYRELEKIGLAAPKVTYVMNELVKNGIPVDVTAITIEEARQSILEGLRK